MAEEVSPVQHEKKVPTKSAVWLSFADCMCALLCSAAEGSVLTYFFVYHLGLNWGLASIVWLIFGIWNAINDPIYGFIADRTKNKLGRRIPWIRYGAPIYAAVFIVMWIKFPSMAGNQGFLFAQMLITVFFFDILYTAIASALYVMPYEMAVTNKARSPIFIWKIVFSLISTGIPMFFNGQISDLLDTTKNPNGYTTFMWIMVAVGILAGLVIFFSTFFYKENAYVKDEPQPKFWDGLKACLKNKSFLLFEVVSITVIFAQSNLMLGLTAAWTMWGGEEGWFGASSQYFCLGAMAIGAVLALLLFVKKRDAWGARLCTVIMCVAMGIGCFLGAFLGRYFWVLVAAFFLIGVGFAGGMYLIPVINGDVIDKDEIDNGSRREGTYAGVNSLITKPFMSIAQVTYMAILEGIFGLTHTTDSQGQPIYDWASQSMTVKNGFFIAWFLIAAILLVLSAIAMWFFPLDGKKWLDEKAALAKKHADKEAAYEQEVLKLEAASASAAPSDQPAEKK